MPSKKAEGKPISGVLCGSIHSWAMKNTNFIDRAGPASRGRRFGSPPRACAAFLLAGLFLASAGVPASLAGEEAEAVAISSKVSSDYARTKLADGSYQTEPFAFAKGGVWKSAIGGSADMLDFMEVARTVAGPLASQRYVSSRDPATTKLLILVYWGTTRTPDHATNSVASQNLQAASAAAMAANHPQMVRFNDNDSCAPMQMAQDATTGYAIRSPEQIEMDNAFTGALAAAAAEDNQRTQLDAQNAGMLGYDSWWTGTALNRGTALEVRQRDIMDELEARRYFVVLMAYDFQKMWKEKKPKLLWETRFSVQDKGNDFSKELAAMAASASQYFGRDSGKLIHKALPQGHVEVGSIKEVAYNPKAETGGAGP